MTSALPFTPAAFFDLFAVYNRTLWPIVGAIWLAALALVWAAWRDPIRYNRALTALLAALWAWNAIVYHGWLFTRINPAAWLFAGLFALEAGLLAAAARQGLSFFAAGGRAPRAGLLLAAYAFAYPLLTVASGHRYPAGPDLRGPVPNRHSYDRTVSDRACGAPASRSSPGDVECDRRLGSHSARRADRLRAVGRRLDARRGGPAALFAPHHSKLARVNHA